MSFDEFMSASIAIDLPKTIITIVHGASIEEQLFIRWLATIDVGNILVYALEKPSVNNNALEKYCHKIIFDMELAFDIKAADDEKNVVNKIIEDTSRLGKMYDRNIIIVTCPNAELLNSIISATNTDKSGMRYTIVINSRAEYENLKEYADLYVITAQAHLSKKIQCQMYGIPDPFSLEPLYFAYVILAISQTDKFKKLDAVEKEDDGNRHIITIKNMAVSSDILSQYVYSVFDEAVPRRRI